jgi:hypothetical protein
MNLNVIQNAHPKQQLLFSIDGETLADRETSTNSRTPQREQLRLSKNTLVLYVTQVTLVRTSCSLRY